MSKKAEMKEVIEEEGDAEQEAESRDEPGSLPSPAKTAKGKEDVGGAALGLKKKKTGASPDASPGAKESSPSRGVAKLRAATKAVGLGLRLQADAANTAQDNNGPEPVTKAQVEKMI